MIRLNDDLINSIVTIIGQKANDIRAMRNHQLVLVSFQPDLKWIFARFSTGHILPCHNNCKLPDQADNTLCKTPHSMALSKRILWK